MSRVLSDIFVVYLSKCSNIYFDLVDGMSASDRIILHKLKKDTKEQSTQIVKLTDMLAATVRETIPPPPCTQWEFVKVWSTFFMLLFFYIFCILFLLCIFLVDVSIS